jgi:hypothetical protein
MVSNPTSGTRLDTPDLPLGVHGVPRCPLTERVHAIRTLCARRDDIRGAHRGIDASGGSPGASPEDGFHRR